MLGLLSAGSNAQGQLGNTTVDDSHVFQLCCFRNLPGGTLPPNTTHVTEVANGANYTLLLLEVKTAEEMKSTEVWGCGDGRLGQLGPGLRQEKPITAFHKLAVETALGKLGLEKYTIKSLGATWETSYLVIARPGSHDAIISFGSNEFGDLGIGRNAGDKGVEKGPGVHIVDFSHVSVAGKTIKSAKTVTVEKLRTGQRHVIVLLKVVWGDWEPIQILIGWGACRHGQLGDVTSSTYKVSSRPSPVRQSTAKPRKPGISSPPTYISQPILVSFSDSPSGFIVDYSLGIHHSAFLHASGRISVKGSNRKNQIQDLETLQSIRDIKCTWNGTCILTADVPTRILSTGSNSHGQLGRADDSSNLQVVTIPLTHASIKALACGSEHSLVLLTVDGRDDEVWGWGWNEHGNLGIGTTVDSPIPQRLWPSSDGYRPHRILNIWGGNGSSWILCETSNDAILSSR